MRHPNTIFRREPIAHFAPRADFALLSAAIVLPRVIYVYNNICTRICLYKYIDHALFYRISV